MYECTKGPAPIQDRGSRVPWENRATLKPPGFFSLGAEHLSGSVRADHPAGLRTNRE